MSTSSKNPATVAIIGGTAPRQAMLAAASGLLPLTQSELLEVLVALRVSTDGEISEAAKETLESQEAKALLDAAKDHETSPAVLDYLATLRQDTARTIHEAVILNGQTSDEAIANLASTLSDASLLSLIAINQQRLVRSPQIIDAILSNPGRSPEAERRARETKQEFFEKERGAQQIAQELRTRGNSAAAEFLESADLTSGLSIEDAWLLAEHIEVSDDELDSSWLPSERFEFKLETQEERDANFKRAVEFERMEQGDLPIERVSMIRRLMFMNVKDRMRMAMKGDREARGILIRDSNRIVATGVIHNPRVTDQEAENIASMRTVVDEVLRLISMNRNWARSYPIIHNLVRNPRTPIPTVIGILPRIRTKDLMNLSQNRNVSEAARRQAMRLSQLRSGG